MMTHTRPPERSCHHWAELSPCASSSLELHRSHCGQPDRLELVVANIAAFLSTHESREEYHICKSDSDQGVAACRDHTTNTDVCGRSERCETGGEDEPASELGKMAGLAKLENKSILGS